MTTQEAILNTILPHFQSQQRQGQDDGQHHLSLEARVRELKKGLASLELGEAVGSLTLADNNEDVGVSELEEEIGNLLVHFIDATVASDATSDLQESVDRVMALIAAFGITYSTEVATKIMERAMEFSTVLLERIRGHACVLLGKIAKTLLEMKRNKKNTEEDLEWIEDCLEQVLEALVPRLQDKGQAVRCHAITAVGNVFATAEDVENYETVLEALMWSVSHDPSVSNRIAAVQSVPVNEKTLDVIISRVRDVKPKVRAEALHALRTKVEDATELSEQQIVDLIQYGFTDRCAVTKEAASKMVCTSWTKAVRYDPIALLKMVGVMDNEDEGNRVLEVVLEAARSEDNELLEELSDPEIRAFKSGIEKATVSLQSSSEGNTGPEQLFFLKARCQSVIDSKELTSSQKDSITSKLIPEIPVLCESFEKHATKLMKAIEDGDEDNQDVESFICLQLLQIAKYADIKEEGSRRHFTYVMKQMLSSVDTPDDLVEGCIQALHMTYDNEAEFVTSVSEILGDIRSAVDNQDVNEDAAGTLETMHTLRILSILSVLLETASVQLSNNPAVSQFAKHIVPSVTHSDVLIREAAVGCFGKLGLFTSEDTVMNEFKPILLEVANSTEERMEIRAQALLALSDWSMLFSDILKPCEIGEKTVSFSELVTNMMSDSRTAAVCIAAEVAAKLSFSGKVCDSSWLAHLLAIYFDPRMIDLMEEDEDIKEVGSAVRLQQLLTIFFPAYCMKSELGRDAFVGSILPMLELIYFEPPKTSHKGKKTTKKKVTWPVVKMIQYVCSMVDYGKNSVVSDDATVVQADKAPEQGDDTSTEATAQDGTNNSASLMAGVQIASFLAKHGEYINVTTLRALCKHLGASEFDLNKEDRNKLVALKTDLEELGMVITDANSLRSLSDLNDLLADIHVDDEDEEPSDEEQEESNAGEDSDATESENDEEEAASEDEDDIAAPASKINLSNDLVAALNGVKIAGDEDSGVFDNAEKENSGKRTSKGKGRKNSSGSAASRRSRLKRLSDISAN